MQLPKLTPLQSRLLASAIATCFVVVVWIFFQPHHFVYAAELPIPEHITPSDFEQALPPALPDAPPIDTRSGAAEERSDGVYAPDFAYFDRALIGRQQDEVNKLTNKQKAQGSASPGSTSYFRFEKSQSGGSRARAAPPEALGVRGLENASGGKARREALTEEDAENGGLETELRRRQSGNQVFISANTCRQPSPTVHIITDPPPQLTLYVSTSARNTKPGPSATENLATSPIPFVGGYANFSVQAGSDIYLGVSAPELTSGWDGGWNFEIAASTDGWYHSYDSNTPFMYMVDTDSESALFITDNLTTSNATTEVDKWKNMRLPFTMYAFPNASWSPMIGLERSVCGLSQQFNSNLTTNSTTNITVASSVTTKFGQGIPKAQFHVQGLKTNTSYLGFLAVNGSTEDMQLPGGGTVRAGGQVFQQFLWTTKVDDSCQVIFDLDWCSDTAYAVPSSSKFKFNTTGLKSLYDNQAKAYYQNFSNSLAQVACDTASTAQYSLARNCTSCKNDYKSWLCSVVIPRCEDWSATDDWLQERNVNAQFADGSIPYASNMSLSFNESKRLRFAYNQSRNPMIDQEIKPGPYKELLPCEDLCFDLVRSCPSVLGFACPNPPAMALSYGKRDASQLKCNFPGAVVNLNQDRGAAGRLAGRVGMVILVAALAAAWSWI